MESQKLVHDELKKLYAAYRGTADIRAKGQFFSPNCVQLCRPRPSYAATNSETIIRYLLEFEDGGKIQGSSIEAPGPAQPAMEGYYTIRPVKDNEVEFGTDEQVGPAGFASPTEIERRARQESWVGMRVDLWDDDGTSQNGVKNGLLVKVKYWWRMEGGVWKQILHDIMYMGPRDGTEGAEGEILR